MRNWKQPKSLGFIMFSYELANNNKGYATWLLELGKDVSGPHIFLALQKKWQMNEAKAGELFYSFFYWILVIDYQWETIFLAVNGLAIGTWNQVYIINFYVCLDPTI